MNYAIAPVVESSHPSSAPISARAAGYLIKNHGNRALREAVRHGMKAKLRGDDDAADFWCGVCSTLVQITQEHDQVVS